MRKKNKLQRRCWELKLLYGYRLVVWHWKSCSHRLVQDFAVEVCVTEPDRWILRLFAQPSKWGCGVVISEVTVTSMSFEILPWKVLLCLLMGCGSQDLASRKRENRSNSRPSVLWPWTVPDSPIFNSSLWDCVIQNAIGYNSVCCAQAGLWVKPLD